MRKKKIDRFLINFVTYSILFSIFINGCVFANANNNQGEDRVREILVDITRVLLVIGGLVCIGKLIQIGIMYMMVSVDQKSQAKTAVLPWLIGTIVCFGAAWIGSAIIKIVNTGNGDVLSY